MLTARDVLLLFRCRRPNARRLARAAALASFAALTACSSGGGTARVSTERLEIARGLRNQYNVAVIADGDVTVMSTAKSMTESSDSAARRMTADYLTVLRAWERSGLLSVAEHHDSAAASKATADTVVVTVTPTDSLRAAADQPRPTSRWLVVPLADCEVVAVESDSLYTSTTVMQQRLIVGTYRARVRPIARKLNPAAKDSTFRFRVLLRGDPTSGARRYLVGDWGYVGKTTWETHNIP